MSTQTTPRRRDPWRLAWNLATGNVTLAVVTFALSLYLLVLTIIPQTTDPWPSDQWMAMVQTRFGSATAPLYRIGLFSLAGSPLPRLPPAMTAFLLLARLVELVLTLRSADTSAPPRRQRADIAAILAYGGALLALLGLLTNHLWGWREEELLAYNGDSLTTAAHGTVELSGNDDSLRSATPGVTVYVTGSGPQIAVQAGDDAGRPLELQQSQQEQTSSTLTASLTTQAPETYIAIPDASLVARFVLTAPVDIRPDALLLVQVFRTPTGELVQEQTWGTGDLAVDVDGTHLTGTRSSYLVLTAAHEPGRWLQIGGLTLGSIGLLGLLAWAQQCARQQRPIVTIARAAMGVLTMTVAGTSLCSLVTTGTLTACTPSQAGLAAIWCAALAVGLALCRPGHAATGGTE